MKSENSQNLRAKGYHRDRAIIEAVEAYKALDAEQIRVMFFPFKEGKRKAQERLLKLYAAGKLKRDSADGPYYYYHEKPGMISHLIGLNWTRLWLERSLKNWEKLHSFTYEKPDYGFIRPDGFAAIQNIATGKYRFLFIEQDRGTNSFDKIPKYCKLYESEKYLTDWWVKLSARFPPVLIVTSRPGVVREAVKKDNNAGLEFQVKTLEEVKEGTAWKA